MKEWIVLQGWPFYIMLGMTAVGLIGTVLSRIFYGRLAKEAQLCGTSDYPMLHYIRQKYSSYYKLGMRPVNASALVKRYLALHKVGVLSLYSWPGIRTLMMGTVMLVGLVNGLYQYQMAEETAPLILSLGEAAVLNFGLWTAGQLLSVQRLEVISENAICDYLENYLKSKLDGEYGYGRRTETPEHYVQALKETAASKSGSGIRPRSVRRIDSERTNSEVDARIVEDVLKEFLC